MCACIVESVCGVAGAVAVVVGVVVALAARGDCRVEDDVAG